jgi:hypothetical protein
MYAPASDMLVADFFVPDAVFANSATKVMHGSLGGGH